MGSDPVKCLVLKENPFRKRVFFLLEGTFRGQKVPSKRWGVLSVTCYVLGVAPLLWLHKGIARAVTN